MSALSFLQSTELQACHLWPKLLAMTHGAKAEWFRPVDIFAEDVCSHCRMAVSDHAFASEIITADRDVFKFDDLGCLEQYRQKNPALKIAAIFVSDYESKEWLPFEKSIIIQTGIATPMGSGKIAVRSAEKARELTQKFPAKETAGNGCTCCSVAGKS